MTDRFDSGGLFPEMEEAPIFVRIIIDIPIKESYNHINKAGRLKRGRGHGAVCSARLSCR